MQLLREIRFIFNKNQKIKIGILLFATLISSVLELIGVTAVMPFVKAIISPEKLLENKYLRAVYDFGGFQSINSFIVLLAIFIILVYIVKNVYLTVLGDWQFRFIYNNQRRLSCEIMETYMRQPYLFHVSNNTSVLMRNVTGDTQVFFRTVLATLQLFTDASICIVLFVFLFIQDKSITLAITTLMLGFVIFYMKIFKKKITYYGSKTRENSADMSKWVLQAFGGVKEAQIMNREMFFVNSYNKVYREYADNQRKNNVLGIIPKPMVETLCISGLLLVISFKLLNGVNSAYFLQVVVTFAIAAFKMMPSFNKITANLGIIVFSRPSVSAVYEDKKRLATLYTSNKEKYDDKEEFRVEKEIVIKDLTFCYPEGNKNVLDAVNLTIPKNKAVAFVGPSGSGKTTLADIILGVLEPTEGKVLVDEVNIHDNLFAWHKKVGYIPQNIYLMDDTLKNNIAFGLNPKEIDEDKILNAVKLAQLKEFTDSLEEGLDTIVGESGMRLSGGQRQRIGIARALYSNPEVLVLDEATSALDNDTEKAVMEAIDNLVGTKTLIIIAHRLSTIKNCELVYEVKDGKVNRIEREYNDGI